MKHLKLFFALFAMLALGVGNAWGADVESYSATFTSVATHSYTQNKTFTLNEKSWTASVSQVNSNVFYLGCNSTHASKGILANNSTFSEIVTALKSVDTKYSSTSNAHAYALLFDNAYDNVTKVNFAWSGGNNAFQVYLFGYTNSTWVLLGSTNYATSGTNTAGSVEWTGTAANYAKFAVVARPGTTSSTATNKTLRAKSFKIYTDDTPVGATKYAITIDPNIQNGTVEADVAEAADGATVTLTATPDAGYKFGAWDVKDASSNAVSVDANGKFTMPASDVTVSASFDAKTQYTIKWNVAEGSVTDTYVYEGDALGKLPTADNCSSGKVFVGWTEATSVKADGSDITYAKEIDVPTVNKEYNAVYATLSGSADKVDNLDLSLTGASGSTYSSWSGKKSVSDAVYAGNSAGGNNAIQLRKSSDSQAKSGIITTTSGGKAKKVVVTWNSNTASGRTLNVYGSNSAYSSVDNLYTDATAGTLIGTIANGTSTELDITGDYEYIGMRSNASAMYLDKIQITWSASSASDYSLDCGTNNTPFLTVTETAIDFGTIAQNETATKTFDVTGGYLAEDVALTISGTNASFFSVSPATITKADDVNETVTVTYNPTEVGEHTATLTIKTGDITKEIALSGEVLAPGKWVLVKDVATLSAGDEIIIASAVADYAIGVAATNNYKGAAITKVGETANTTAEVTILTVEETGVAEAPYAFKDGSKYLYAAGSDKNYLKAQATNNENGQWAITITEGVASIVAAKSSNRNVMQCNPNDGNPIFACYTSAGYQQLAIYRNSENVVKPVISGDADFVGSTQVTITAQSGLTVYYTTNGTDPNNTSAQYTAPFTIHATTTVKAIAYDASSNASGVAEMTFTKHDLVNVTTAMALAKDEIAYFDKFEVVKVVAGKGNIYIKDASGHGLIYDNTLAGELKDGDRVQGFVGISSPYNGLPEAKPVDGLTVADLTITSGTPAEPYDFTSTAITVDDLNKYIVFKEVPMDADVDVTTHPTLRINGNSVNLRNSFNVTKTLENGKKYDIYGFVSIYNESLQVSFYQALEQGEVVKTYTVTYNAGGAIGTVPVDDNEYTAGAQVYLKSATGLTKEGYEYKGWKVTDEGGNEIAVSSNKFNMPASNVTATAQWEEIVVVPRQDFSAGKWVLVTDASELNADDYVIIAAANLEVAMKSYESGNYCTHMAVTKDGSIFLKWHEDLGVFQLSKGNEFYTFKDVNTNQYLYAAGTGNNNHLKATDEIPADAEAVKPYIWTITIEDGVTTVKATSENRNTLKYNKTSGQERFSCYASGQEDIALYKYFETLPTYTITATANPTEAGNIAGADTYELGATVTLTATANDGYEFVNWTKDAVEVSTDATYTFTVTENVTLVANFVASTPSTPTPDYTRTVTPGYYGTICLSYGSSKMAGATFYETSHYEDGKVYFNEVTTLVAGHAYIFLARANQIEIYKEGDETVADPVVVNGLYGTFTRIDDVAAESAADEYIIVYNSTTAQCELSKCLTNCWLEANRAYVVISEIGTTPKQPMPGCSRVGMAVEGENGETGFENITAPEGQSVKAIVNGQLIIIRDGVQYNAQGQLIK